MREHSVSLRIGTDPDDLVAFLADLRNDVTWRHDLALSELVSGTPGEPGSVYRQKGTTPGRDDPYLIELSSLDRAARIATFATVDRAPVAFGGRYLVAEAAHACDVTMAVWVRASGMLRLLAPFMGKAVRRNSERYLSDLKALREKS